MAESVVLKARYTLWGRSILPLIGRVRQAENVRALARFNKEKALDTYDDTTIKMEFHQLTGHVLDEVLAAAGQEATRQNRLLAAHHAILLANDMGQPRGQQLGPGQRPPQQHEAAGERMQQAAHVAVPQASSSAVSRKRPADADMLSGSGVSTSFHTALNAGNVLSCQMAGQAPWVE